MKKLIAFVFISIFLITFIQAKAFQQGSEVDLKVPFEVNGSAASASATCNISIQYPNSTYIYQNEGMTNLGNGNFNITLTDSDTSILGQYRWVAFCCEDGRCAAGYGDITITPSGADRINSGEGMSVVASLLAIVIVGIFLFVLSMRFNNPMIKFSMIVLSSIMILVVVLYSMVLVQQNLGEFSSVIQGFSTFYTVIKVAASLAMLALIIMALLVAIRFYKFKRGLLD